MKITLKMLKEYAIKFDLMYYVCDKDLKYYRNVLYGLGILIHKKKIKKLKLNAAICKQHYKNIHSFIESSPTEKQILDYTRNIRLTYNSVKKTFPTIRKSTTKRLNFRLI